MVAIAIAIAALCFVSSDQFLSLITLHMAVEAASEGGRARITMVITRLA